MEYATGAIIFFMGYVTATVVGWLRLRRIEAQLADLTPPPKPTNDGPLLPDSRARRAGL